MVPVRIQTASLIGTDVHRGPLKKPKTKENIEKTFITDEYFWCQIIDNWKSYLLIIFRFFNMATTVVMEKTFFAPK